MVEIKALSQSTHPILYLSCTTSLFPSDVVEQKPVAATVTLIISTTQPECLSELINALFKHVYRQKI